ncbi:hypothetical protein ACQJBY_063026 [Aegilops geniculata]
MATGGRSGPSLLSHNPPWYGCRCWSAVAGGEERDEEGNMFKVGFDDIESRAAARLAQVWKANPGLCHLHFRPRRRRFPSIVDSGGRSALPCSPTILRGTVAGVGPLLPAERSVMRKETCSRQVPTTLSHGRPPDWPRSGRQIQGCATFTSGLGDVDLDHDGPGDLMFHFQANDNLKKTLCESDITYINMLAIIGIKGSDHKDFMYYVKQEGVGMAQMQLIK